MTRNAYCNNGNNAQGNSQSGQGPARIIITGVRLNEDFHWWYRI